MVDLTVYADQILAKEDRPLFDDAVAAAKVDALRAAYLMIWLACAESLKRRFREAQKRDGTAGKVVGDIEAKEKEHKSVDRFVLEKARDYGFLSDAGHTVLNHVYEMRCIYGHPYEEAPSAEQVSHAAAVAVEHVLSQPVKLRHGFGDQLLESLLNNRSYLDDQQSAVAAFTKDIVPRIDENIHGWLLDKYWSHLEMLADDSSMAIFFRRGIWFSRTLLTEVGVDVFTREEWHDRCSRSPKTLFRVCSVRDIFTELGKRARDTLVGAILTEAGTRASVLKHLERLEETEALSSRHLERFREHVESMDSKALRSSGLSTRTCFDRVIAALRAHNWYVQNPAIDLVRSNGPSQASALEEAQQLDLGRNILQAAEGNSGSAIQFLDTLAEDGTSWPFDVVRGIALEVFTNEDNEIRFKDRHLETVLSILDDIKTTPRKKILVEIVDSIDEGTPKAWVDQDNYADVIKVLTTRSWALPLVKCLESKAASLPDEEDD